MKKFYSILLASAVALSAAAGTSNLQADVNAAKTLSGNFELARNAKAEKVNIAGHKSSENTLILKAPAKAAPQNMEELVGIYDYTAVLYKNTGNVGLAGNVVISKGEGANDVVVTGLRYIDVSLKGTVDFSKGTITLPSQFIFAQPEDPEYPGVSMNMWLYTSLASETAWSNEAITIKMNSDGTLTSSDMFVYGVEGLAGSAYAIFDNVKIVPSECNTTVTLWEYDTDAQGTYLTTTTEFNTYCKAELVEDYVDGTDHLGECVVLEQFLGPDYSANETYNLPLVIYRDDKEVYLDPVKWINIDLTVGGKPTECLLAPVSTLGQDESIVGTLSANTIEWTTDWLLMAYDASTQQRLGSLAKFKGAHIELPFNVENPGAGISDVIADSDANAPVEFFNLQGARISNPAAGQLVIRRQGKTVTKVLVK